MTSTKDDVPWVALEAVSHLYGVSFATAKNKIQRGEFDVPTYRVGKKIVIDKVVHETFFANRREAGLRAIESTKR